MSNVSRPSTLIATITVSDTRDASRDSGGTLLRDRLAQSGFTLGPHAIVRDDLQAIQAAVQTTIADSSVGAIVITGGTGIGPRDVTIEAIEPLFEKRIDGFGEAFRRLSWEHVGTRAILSRAVAGVVKGRLVFALPGSPKAVALGVEQLVAGVLGHALEMLVGKGHG